MVNKTLIIKSSDNGFERFVTSYIESKGYDIAEPYQIAIDEMTKIQRLRFGSRIPVLYGDLISSWKDKINKYDTFVIFDNALTIQLVRYIASKNRESDIRVWLWNRRNIKKELYLKYCHIYTFDEDFAKDNGFTFIPQFYFNDAIDSESNGQPGVYYIGYDKERYSALEQLSELFQKYGINYQFILRKVPNKEYGMDTKIILTDRDVEYNKVLKDMSAYSCLLELNEESQTGLTLRSLEALFGRKKLITNNHNIINYDFYNKNNIFIIGEDKEQSLLEFINNRYMIPPKAVIDKYTFDYWIKQITGER